MSYCTLDEAFRTPFENCISKKKKVKVNCNKNKTKFSEYFNDIDIRNQNKNNSNSNNTSQFFEPFSNYKTDCCFTKMMYILISIMIVINYKKVIRFFKKLLKI